MLGSDIKQFFDQHPVLCRHFLGVFAADQVRTVLRRLRNRSIAIFNTDVLNGGTGGKHWWCLAKLENKLEAFDPLGITEDKLSVRLGKSVFCYFNYSAVQPDTSVLCGYFCCYWVKYVVDLVNVFNTTTSYFTGLRKIFQR